VGKEEFYRKYVSAGKPIIITGMTADWKAGQAWDFDYFLAQYGNSEVQAYKLNDRGECEVDVEKGSATRPAVLRDCLISMNEPEIKKNWSVACSVQHFPAQLRKEFSPPIYCADGKFLRSMIFIGPKGVVSPLHQDLPENLYVMVKGKKRITLFAPMDHVYPNSRLSNLPNHSQIDAEDPDYSRFPKTREAQPYIVDLCAGETLFIPSFWWHHLRNLEPSIALNFWWSQGWKLPIAWAAAVYKKYRKI
jgi:Cupin-like domain